MQERKYWRITYLPASSYPRVVEWVFHGTEQERDDYLLCQHSCSCEDCQVKESWWDTAQSCEYIVEEIVEDE
jgi:hypothetical protein